MSLVYSTVLSRRQAGCHGEFAQSSRVSLSDCACLLAPSPHCILYLYAAGPNMLRLKWAMSGSWATLPLPLPLPPSRTSTLPASLSVFSITHCCAEGVSGRRKRWQCEWMVVGTRRWTGAARKGSESRRRQNTEQKHARQGTRRANLGDWDTWGFTPDSGLCSFILPLPFSFFLCFVFHSVQAALGC